MKLQHIGLYDTSYRRILRGTN